ncbi:MAG TPA: hypothetical protein VFZ56_03885 [Gemmatimonadaceae bacterium]
MIISRIAAVLTVAAVLVACDGDSTSPLAVQADATRLANSAAGGRAGALGVVYVRSQGLYYDTFVSAEALPMEGEFQQIENGVTEYGPGDPEYKGGRWWADVNGNGSQDAGDRFFLCPLLPPGRPNP